MSQLPPEQEPSPPRKHRRDRRRHTPALLSLWQFVGLSTTIAIAILAGGLWLLHRVTRPPLIQSSPTTEANPAGQTGTASPESGRTLDQKPMLTDEPVTFFNTVSPATELLPDVQLDPDPLDPDPKYRPTPELQSIWRYRYNVALLPNLQPSQPLQELVEDIKQAAAKASLPPEAMSIVLIDLNNQAIATHNPDQPQYPASVAKLFWMVALYGQFDQGFLDEVDFEDKLKLMVTRSDNNATSQIIDAITRTKFQAKGTLEEYNIWHDQRLQLNQFFSQAGYQNLNITQKTYPIPDIKVEAPTGFDRQMRQNPDNPADPNPIRNQLTASHAARLMYDIVTRQAIAPEASQKMLQLLRRDLTQDWQTPTNYFNPVQDFFGKGLPQNAQLFSKAGWTTQGRHEVAYITSADGNQKYILCIFAEQKDYAKNETFFPEVARLTYQNLSQSSR